MTAQGSRRRFDLVQELGEAKTVEIARIVAIAERLSERFGPDVIVGFLFCELLGRRPDRGEYASHVERLRGSPSSLPEIIAALLSLAKGETPPSPV